jgi:putative endonuclease
MATHRTFIASYIMASGRNGTIYIGSTSNLISRVWKHKTRVFPGFTDDNDCTDLVWFQRHVWMTAAIRRERRLKKWLRDWKLALIERENPEWRDLAADPVSRERSGLDATGGGRLAPRSFPGAAARPRG